jgi:formate hydrogenlyase subunit 6/NADH:ubiquinone oxidoreductase subunit I
MGKSRISPMIKEVLAQLFKKPATGKYPFVKPNLPEHFRGKQVFDTNLCIGCGLCAKDCPAKAIEMVEVGGKKKPLFKLDVCIYCYQCAETCPKGAIKSTTFFELATTDKPSLVLRPTASTEVKPQPPKTDSPPQVPLQEVKPQVNKEAKI